MTRLGKQEISKPVTFYVQAGAAIGLGHLARSVAVSRWLSEAGFESNFHLVADALGRGEATALGIGSSVAPSTGGGTVVIDAVSISKDDAQWISSFENRVLISPVCNRGDLATHVLVRRLTKTLRSSLPEEISLIEDPAFAFVTAADLSRRTLSFERLIVGICLSGGEMCVELDPLLRAVASVPNVSEVHVLSRVEPSPWSREKPRLVWQAQHRKPWSFLGNINLFIGGQGLMVAEAIAQGLPVISLGQQPSSDTRNHHLVESGCLREMWLTRFNAVALQNLLAEPAALVAMHRATRTAAPIGSAEKLPQNIHTILTRE